MSYPRRIVEARRPTAAQSLDPDACAATLPAATSLPNQPPASADVELPAPGTVVGDGYRVLGRLGGGAMGVVLLALDERLDRKVAIKLIRPELSWSDFRERFVSEARAMARVNHPNVLHIHSFGEYQNIPYFVMELVEGRTLDQWLATGPSPPELETALRILRDVCRGVAAIHAADTLHRDLKPSNILLDAELRAHVADLGLSVLCRGPSKAEVVGTPAYMAPEITSQDEIDPALRQRADVYSLGCIAYELITGHRPSEDEDAIARLLKHDDAPPRSARAPSLLRPGLPAAFDEVIMRALAEDPSERTPSAEAFARALAAARLGSSEPDRILVAEDDDDFRTILGAALTREFPDAEIDCVGDGRAALESFERKRPSVVLLDLCIPTLGGLELTGLMRARESSSTTPIIVLTGSGGPDEWKRLSAMGADRFLVKPVHLDDVVATVRRVLRERSHSSPPSGAPEAAPG
jgi:serine/threonine-protein kinase